MATRTEFFVQSKNGNWSAIRGCGDMVTSTYDKNKDGKVDLANDSEMLGGKSADSFYNLGSPTKSVASGADFDTLTVGKYLFSGNDIRTFINFPTNLFSNASGMLVVEKVYGDVTVQRIIGNTAESIELVRKKHLYNGNVYWTDWQRVAYTDNISNPALNINPDFRVNQRGQSSYSGVGYTVDMWTFTSEHGTLLVNDNYVTISSSNTDNWLCSCIEDGNKYLGETLTLSVKLKDGKVYSSTGTVPNSLPSNPNKTEILRIVVDSGLVIYAYLRFDNLIQIVMTVYSGYSYDVKYVKLELGNVATPLSPRPYGEELALCQRYLDLNLGHAYVYYMDSHNIYFAVPTTTTLRGAVTLIGRPNVVADDGYFVVSGSSTLEDGFTFGINEGKNNQITINAYKQNHGLTKDMFIRLTFKKYAGFSSEL